MGTVTERSRVVEIARSWHGVGYKHEGKSREEGVDCINLILEIWREANPESAILYDERWAFVQTPEDFSREAAPYWTAIPFIERRVGDILIFKPARRGKAVHCGLLVSRDDDVIHCYDEGGVQIDKMPTYWFRRCLLTFRFPWITGFDPTC